MPQPLKPSLFAVMSNTRTDSLAQYSDDHLCYLASRFTGDSDWFDVAEFRSKRGRKPIKDVVAAVAAWWGKSEMYRPDWREYYHNDE